MKVSLLYKKYLFTIIILGSSLISLAQSNVITGYVIDKNDIAINDYHIRLLNKKDSSQLLVKNFSQNKFSLEKPSTESFIKITCLGYEDTCLLVPNINSNVDLGKIVLANKLYNLPGVTVYGKAPIMSMRNGKLIYNVENTTISNSGTAIDILQRTPYIITDPNGLITVAGRDKALVLVNGKQIRSTEELQLLNSSKVKQIVIIENPSAKYDAEGHSVIDIITKKSLGEGLQSSIYLNYKQGKRGAFYLTPEFSYEFGKIRLRASLGVEIGESEGKNQTWIEYKRDNYLFNSYTYDLKRLTTSKSYTYNSGIDYVINKKNSIGIYFDGYWRKEDLDVLSNLEITKNTIIHPTLQTILRENSIPYQTSVGINYDFKDSNGIEISFMNNYTNYITGVNSLITEVNQASFRKYEMNSYFDNKFNLVTSKLDASIPIPKIKGKLDFGGKYSYINANSNLDFKRFTLGNWTTDASFSNDVNFIESIFAGYVSLTAKIKKVSLLLGVRAENTKTDNISKFIENGIYRNEDFKFFPNVSIEYQPNETVNYQLNYSRRISRPSYSSLNNSVLYIDSLSTKKGNPFLNATIYNTLSSTISWAKKINMSISYSYIESPSDMLFINDLTEIEKYTVLYKNVKDSWSISLNLGGNFRYKQWTTQPAISYSYRPVTIIDDGKEYTFNNSMYMIRSINQISLGKNWSVDVNASFQQPAYSFKKFGKQLDLDIGVSKKMFKDKLILQTNFHNSFMPWTQKYEYSYKYGYVMWNGNNRHLFNLSIRYNFGNKKIILKDRKSNVEEMKRL